MNFVLGTATPLGDALNTVASELSSTIGDVLPIAAGIVAAVVGVNFGFRLFKKITGTRS
jgi:hypothetical protein